MSSQNKICCKSLDEVILYAERAIEMIEQKELPLLKKISLIMKYGVNCIKSFQRGELSKQQLLHIIETNSKTIRESGEKLNKNLLQVLLDRNKIIRDYVANVSDASMKLIVSTKAIEDAPLRNMQQIGELIVTGNSHQSFANDRNFMYGFIKDHRGDRKVLLKHKETRAIKEPQLDSTTFRPIGDRSENKIEVMEMSSTESPGKLIADVQNEKTGVVSPVEVILVAKSPSKSIHGKILKLRTLDESSITNPFISVKTLGNVLQNAMENQLNEAFSISEPSSKSKKKIVRRNSFLVKSSKKDDKLNNLMNILGQIMKHNKTT